MIDGNTVLIAHLGYPTSAFKAPLIYNPYFEKSGINAIVVPMGVRPEGYAGFLPNLFRLTNIRGALVTMPHKITTLSLVDEVSTTAKIAGACNAIRLREDGTLTGDMFDGDGFVRCMMRRGRNPSGARALVVGNGGAGCAIAASLAKAGVAALGLFDLNANVTSLLVGRLRSHYPKVEIRQVSSNPEGYDIIVNATPIGMSEGDPLPINVNGISKSAFVGEVVMKEELTPLLAAAAERGCETQSGTDMLFEQIPAYLEFFGFPATTPDELRAVAKIAY
jgi:shikimate dehydrogenase